MTDRIDDAGHETVSEHIIEQHLEHLHRGGPPVDLAALPPETAAQIEPLLMIVDLLIDLGPSSPPIEDDPVAVRLGIMPPRLCSPTRGRRV